MRRGIGLIVACAWLVIAAGASGLQPAVAGACLPPRGRSSTSTSGTSPAPQCPSTTPIWAIATYDGAHLRTYVARGDGTHLALDRSVARTGTLNTAPGGSGTNEDAEAFFNGTMSRFLVYGRALTQSQIASVISGSALAGG